MSISPILNILMDILHIEAVRLFSTIIAKKYGREKVAEIVMNVKGKGGVDQGLKASIGLTVDELSERWKKDIKRVFWPDITEEKTPMSLQKG